MSNIIIPGREEPRTVQILTPEEFTGGFETYAITDTGKERIYHRRQTVGFILNDNERQRRDVPDWNRNSDVRQVASVPFLIWDLWESAGITEDPKELRKALMRHKDEHMIVEKKLI